MIGPITCFKDSRDPHSDLYRGINPFRWINPSQNPRNTSFLINIRSNLIRNYSFFRLWICLQHHISTTFKSHINTFPYTDLHVFLMAIFRNIILHIALTLLHQLQNLPAFVHPFLNKRTFDWLITCYGSNMKSALEYCSMGFLCRFLLLKFKSTKIRTQWLEYRPAWCYNQLYKFVTVWCFCLYLRNSNKYHGQSDRIHEVGNRKRGIRFHSNDSPIFPICSTRSAGNRYCGPWIYEN